MTCLLLVGKTTALQASGIVTGWRIRSLFDLGEKAPVSVKPSGKTSSGNDCLSSKAAGPGEHELLRESSMDSWWFFFGLSFNGYRGGLRGINLYSIDGSVLFGIDSASDSPRSYIPSRRRDCPKAAGTGECTIYKINATALPS